MDWDGIIGSVASVINTALPLLLAVLDENPDQADGSQLVIPNQPIGPGLLVYDSGTFRFANPAENPGPICFNFSPPSGDTSLDNEVIIIAPNEWSDSVLGTLQKYTDGTVTVGITTSGDSSQTPSDISGWWTWLPGFGLGIKEVLTAYATPVIKGTAKLLMEFRLSINANNQMVVITAIAGAVVLGRQYMITAEGRNQARGRRVGALRQRRVGDAVRDGNDVEYELDLPSGVDYSDGIISFELQLEVPLIVESGSSNLAMNFEPIPPAKERARIGAVSKRSTFQTMLDRTTKAIFRPWRFCW